MAVQLVRYQLEHGGALVVEVSAETEGYQRAGRSADGVVEAGATLQETLKGVLPAANALVEELAKLKASAITVEFGIKLSGEANAIVAKTSAEGHFTVALTFGPRGDEAAKD